LALRQRTLIAVTMPARQVMHHAIFPISSKSSWSNGDNPRNNGMFQFDALGHIPTVDRAISSRGSAQTPSVRLRKHARLLLPKRQIGLTTQRNKKKLLHFPFGDYWTCHWAAATLCLRVVPKTQRFAGNIWRPVATANALNRSIEQSAASTLTLLIRVLIVADNPKATLSSIRPWPAGPNPPKRGFISPTVTKAVDTNRPN